MQRKFNFLCWSSLQCIVVLAFTRKYTIFSAWKRSQISTWISALENAHKYISSLSLNFGAITHESTGKFERVHRSWSGVRQHTSEMFTGGGAPTVPPAARLATSAPWRRWQRARFARRHPQPGCVRGRRNLLKALMRKRRWRSACHASTVFPDQIKKPAAWSTWAWGWKSRGRWETPWGGR